MTAGNLHDVQFLQQSVVGICSDSPSLPAAAIVVQKTRRDRYEFGCGSCATGHGEHLQLVRFAQQGRVISVGDLIDVTADEFIIGNGDALAKFLQRGAFCQTVVARK